MVGGVRVSYTVSSDGASEIQLHESDRIKSILRNISILLRTRQGSVPLYREFGLPMNFLDKPLPVAVPTLIMETREAIMRFEPRAEFVTANLVYNAAGILTAQVEVNILNEESGL